MGDGQWLLPYISYNNTNIYTNLYQYQVGLALAADKEITPK